MPPRSAGNAEPVGHFPKSVSPQRGDGVARMPLPEALILKFIEPLVSQVILQLGRQSGGLLPEGIQQFGDHRHFTENCIIGRGKRGQIERCG